MSKLQSCGTCQGSGETPTDFGAVDCPDCGGAGFLPPSNVLSDWRARDIEKRLSSGATPENDDVRWLLAQVRTSRTALTEIIALAHDINDSDAIAMRIRATANRALGMYAIEPAE